MSPERIARLRAFAAAFEGTPLGDPIVELLLENENLSTERERLRGAIAARHRPAQVDGDCTCGVSLIDAGCPLCEYECWVWADEEQTSTELCQCAVDAHAAHVAAILDGGGA